MPEPPTTRVGSWRRRQPIGGGRVRSGRFQPVDHRRRERGVAGSPFSVMRWKMNTTSSVGWTVVTGVDITSPTSRSRRSSSSSKRLVKSRSVKMPTADDPSTTTTAPSIAVVTMARSAWATVAWGATCTTGLLMTQLDAIVFDRHACRLSVADWKHHVRLDGDAPSRPWLIGAATANPERVSAEQPRASAMRWRRSWGPCGDLREPASPDA